MTYSGVVKGRIIELAEDLPLPEGTRVEVSVSVPAASETIQIALRCAGILKDLPPQQQAMFEEALARRIKFSRGLPR